MSSKVKGEQWRKWLQVAAEKEGDKKNGGKEERKRILEILKSVLISICMLKIFGYTTISKVDKVSNTL